MAAEKRISENLDTYFDRSRKTISQWVSVHLRSELSKVNGNITYPIKKPLQDIYDYIMLDPHLNSVTQQRKSKVTGEEFAIFTNGVIDEELTQLLNKQWFSKTLEGVIESKLYGYTLIEVQEIVNNEISDVKMISRGNVIPEVNAIVKNPFQVNEGSLIRLEKRSDAAYYILVDSGDLGLLNKVVPLVMMKRLTLSSWATANETFATPSLVVKTDNLDKKDDIHKDLTNFVSSRRIVMGTTDSFEMLASNGGDPYKTYKELIEVANAEISKAIIGQTSTTDIKSYVGSAEVHERVANEISESDREYMTHVINGVIFPKLIALGYKLENSTFKFISKEKRSYQEKLDTIKMLKETGYLADADDIKEYLDIPFPIEIVDQPVSTVDSFKKKV